MLWLFLAASFVGNARGACPMAYPHSPKQATSLFAVNDSLISDDSTRVVLQSISGTVSKFDAPAIYRIDSQDYYSTWLSEMVSFGGVKVNWDFAGDANSLIEYFLSKYSTTILAGIASYSASSPSSLSKAVTYCAGSLTGAFTAEQSVAQELSLLFDIPIVFDGTKDELPDNNLSFSKNVITFQQPSAQAFMVDYAVFARSAFLTWDDPARDAWLDELEAESSGCAAAFGWVGDENDFVSTLTKRGIWVHASDWAKNIDTLTNVNVDVSMQTKPAAARPRLKARSGGVHTATFVVTDGDNIQWLLNGFTGPDFFGSSDRPATPMGFTLPPALADLAPVVLHYLYTRADPAVSSFVASPSGYGYMYPEELDQSALQRFADETAAVMKSTNMRILNILAGDDDMRNETLQRSSQPFLSHDNVDAVFYYTYGSGYAGGQGKAICSRNGKPVISARLSLWGDNDDPSASPMLSADGIIAALEQQSLDYSSSDGYSLIPVHAWSHNVTDVKYILDHLSPSVQVVTPTEFLKLYIENVKCT
jgi:hypothetical protein